MYLLTALSARLDLNSRAHHAGTWPGPCRNNVRPTNATRPRIVRRRPRPRRHVPPSPPRRSACGRERGSAASTPANACPRPPARRCRRRTAGGPPAGLRPPSSASATSATGTVASTTSATSSSTGGYGDTTGAGRWSSSGSASRSSSIATVRLGRPSASITFGCSSPAWPTGQSPTRSCGAAARVPRQQVRGDDGAARRRTPRRRVARPRTASAQFAGRPLPHQPACSRWPVSTTATCNGCCGSAACMVADLARRSAAVRHRRPAPAPAACAAASPARCGTAPRPRAPRDRLRCSVSSSPGSSVVASSCCPASSGFSTLTVWRRTSSAARPKASNTAGETNGNGSTSTNPSSASARDTVRRRRCCSVRPRPARRGRQHGRDRVVALQPQHLLDQVGGLREVRAPGRRHGGHDRRAVVGRGDLDAAADLAEPARRDATGVAHARDPVRQVDRHRHGLGQRRAGRRRCGRAGCCRRRSASQQPRRALQRDRRQRRVDRALEPLGRLARQLVPADRAGDGRRVPDRGLQQDVRAVVPDLGASRRPSHRPARSRRCRRRSRCRPGRARGPTSSSVVSFSPALRAADDQAALQRRRRRTRAAAGRARASRSS